MAQVQEGTAERILERFNKHLDERILSYRAMPAVSPEHRRLLDERVRSLEWDKINLTRITKEEMR